MNIAAGEYELTNLKRINVVLGKNGCGKSTLLKAVETNMTLDGERKYITPERGGALSYQPNIEQNITTDVQWLKSTRRVNQFTQFREQSVAQFRRLELAVLRRSEGKEIADFTPYMDRLNSLLDNIKVERHDPTFRILSKVDGTVIDPQSISSGEAELISLGIEAMAFAEELDQSKDNFLFLDEPDVHLHPDLQGRLVTFLVGLVETYKFAVIMATHSTAILGALSTYDETAVAFMQARERKLAFEVINEIHRRVLPVFGAHPLSNVFNEAPILIVEGEDDERVWQQAVRTANGKIRLYPVACDSVTSMSAYEQEVRRIIGAVYEDARGYSLRDRDGSAGEIGDELPVLRMKLACRAAENLILSDDVLAACDLTWDETKTLIAAWIADNPDHPKQDDMAMFQADGFDRKGADIKSIRTLLVGVILNSAKSWEVLVGQAIGRLSPTLDGDAVPDDSLEAFLGPKTTKNLIAAS